MSFFGGDPILSGKILREGAEFVLIDGQVLRCQRIIRVELVQVFGIL